MVVVGQRHCAQFLCFFLFCFLYKDGVGWVRGAPFGAKSILPSGGEDGVSMLI